jgi:uncharacterized protein (DUF1330 family)
MANDIESRAARLTAHYGEQNGPTTGQWQRMLSGPAGTPITLINFFKLRASAEGGTALDAMMRYASVSGPTLEKVGGRFLLTGPFEATLMGEDEDWDIVAIASYPDRAALVALHEDEAYQRAWAYRVAAVERQRVVIAAG